MQKCSEELLNKNVSATLDTLMRAPLDRVESYVVNCLLLSFRLKKSLNQMAQLHPALGVSLKEPLKRIEVLILLSTESKRNVENSHKMARLEKILTGNVPTVLGCSIRNNSLFLQPLKRPGRVYIREGDLLKQSRKNLQKRVFILFR